METKAKPRTSQVYFGKAAVYTFGDSKLTNARQDPKPTADKPWYPWGDTNEFPQEVFDTVYENDIKPDLIETSVNMLLGDGVQYYYRVPQNGKWGKSYVIVDEVERLFEACDIQQFCIERATNLELFANAFTEGIEENGRVVNIKNKTALDVRAEFYNQALGRICNYYVSGNWKKARYIQDTDTPNCWRVPAFNKFVGQPKWLHHSKYYMPGQDYYSFPIWWFGTKKWAELSNEVPGYQLGNIKNASNLKLHIEGPASYFDDCDGDQQKELDKKKSLQKELDEKLLNVDADKRASIFYTWVEQIGGVTEEWKITPIDLNLQDKTFLDSYNVSSRANTRGHGIHPVLAGIDLGGNLGSGSEIRNLFNYQMIAKLPKKRQTFLQIFYDFKAKNKLDSRLEFEISYQQMVTGDVSSSGLVSTSK